MQQAVDLSQVPATATNRLVALSVACVCAAPLVLASMLTPAGAGMGTHMQLGLPDCGFKLATGLPCATCGCTTAFAHAANGSMLDSFVTQPFGAALALGLAIMTLVALSAAWSGVSLIPAAQALLQRRVVLSAVGLLLVGWAYKVGLVLAGVQG